ncbi:hypothetical protein BDR03DRAFT_1003726 [Suillus americanus]|nr:hypothetical protein BDR03DRAFT_1003726 [Suillus americanus]
MYLHLLPKIVLQLEWAVVLSRRSKTRDSHARTPREFPKRGLSELSVLKRSYAKATRAGESLPTQNSATDGRTLKFYRTLSPLKICKIHTFEFIGRRAQKCSTFDRGRESQLSKHNRGSSEKAGHPGAREGQAKAPTHLQPGWEIIKLTCSNFENMIAVPPGRNGLVRYTLMGGARPDRESCGEGRRFEEAPGWKRVERGIRKRCGGKTEDGVELALNDSSPTAFVSAPPNGGGCSFQAACPLPARTRERGPVELRCGQ